MKTDFCPFFQRFGQLYGGEQAFTPAYFCLVVGEGRLSLFLEEMEEIPQFHKFHVINHDFLIDYGLYTCSCAILTITDNQLPEDQESEDSVLKLPHAIVNHSNFVRDSSIHNEDTCFANRMTSTKHLRTRNENFHEK